MDAVAGSDRKVLLIPRVAPGKSLHSMVNRRTGAGWDTNEAREENLFFLVQLLTMARTGDHIRFLKKNMNASKPSGHLPAKRKIRKNIYVET